jgi:hypothetical protein
LETQADAKSLGNAFQTAKQKQVNAILSVANRPFFAEGKWIVELARQIWVADHLLFEGVRG